MENKSKFVTGENYTLKDFFSENIKIIIPDLQRDYCWGNNSHTDEKKELVSGFVQNLIQLYESSTTFRVLNMGLIYGYEAPKNHLQLCDGQQRMTTLFLLLGMLNRKTKDNAFRNLLISDYEYEQDDREPYLQYSIRETSLYFLSDLVCHFFIKETTDNLFVESSKELQNSTWFYNEYKTDPSISSMLRAIEVIDKTLQDKNEDWCKKFGDFLSTKLSFMYYDMENRRNGEETFVIINTTGEPLSATQNLKPQIITEPINKDYTHTVNGKNKSISEDWEEIETWFWKERSNGNDTADAGFNEFLRWITLINSDKKEQQRILTEGKYIFPKSKITFSEIYSYWQIIKYLFKEWSHHTCLNINYLSPSSHKDYKGAKIIGQIDCFQLLPLMAYCKVWGIPDGHDDLNLLRLYQFVHNLARIDSVKNSVNELVFDVITIASSCKDLIDIIGSDIEITISKSVLSDEEKTKLQILKDNIQEREIIEDSFWRIQSCKSVYCHNIWSGRIMPLIQWATDSGKFSLEKFNNYSELFDSIFCGKCKDNIDIVRRALLTRNLKGYPRIFRGNTNYSFGWEWKDWQSLINDNLEEFKAFFDDLANGITMQQMIDSYDVNKDWAEFVHKDYLLHYCHYKNIQWYDAEGWMLINQTRATNRFSVNNYHLKKYLDSFIETEPNWETWKFTGDRLVVENKKNDLVFDIWYHQGKWTIQFFKRKGDSINILKDYVDDTWSINGKRYEKYIDYEPNVDFCYPNVKDQLFTIISKLK